MAIIIETSTPKTLLASIKKAIDEKKIETWSYDTDGDFTHTPEQWKYKAWLRPKTSDGVLTFNILGSKATKLGKTTYGVYHGRFIESVLTHFDDKCTSAKATSNLVSGDIIGG